MEPTQQQLLWMYETMLVIREYEETMAKVLKAKVTIPERIRSRGQLYSFAIHQRNRPQPDLVRARSDGFFGKFGRREWTRTIDPHHVKVVL